MKLKTSMRIYCTSKYFSESITNLVSINKRQIISSQLWAKNTLIMIHHKIRMQSVKYTPYNIINTCYIYNKNPIMCMWISYTYTSNLIFTSQGISYIVPLHNPLTKVGLEDACDVSLLSANQTEWSFQSECSGYTISTFQHVLMTQWEMACNWIHMWPLEPIK